MADIKQFSTEMQQYFNRLPKVVQESIMQSGVEIADLADLQNCEKMVRNSDTSAQ